MSRITRFSSRIGRRATYSMAAVGALAALSLVSGPLDARASVVNGCTASFTNSGSCSAPIISSGTPAPTFHATAVAAANNFSLPSGGISVSLSLQCSVAVSIPPPPLAASCNLATVPGVTITVTVDVPGEGSFVVCQGQGIAAAACDNTITLPASPLNTFATCNVTATDSSGVISSTFGELECDQAS